MQEMKYWVSLALTMLIVLGTSVHSHAQRELPDEVKVDASFVDIPIDSALILLSARSGVNISYNSALIPSDKLCTVEATRLELGNVIDDILTGTVLKYKIVANQLVIIKDPALIKKPIFTVSGWVSREESEERILYANVFTHDRSVSTQTNEFGFFSISLRQGVNILNFTSFPLEDKIQTIDIQKDTTLNIFLSEHNELQEILITDEIPNKSKQAEQFDQVPLEMLGSLSSLAGEPDVMRLVQARAGVNTAADGLGGISIRGGNADQNLVLMDGMPVYNTGHALGLFSIFNSGAIKDVKVIKSGFPARYGGRVSSVIDVTLKEGNKQELSGEVNANPLLVSGTLEGPISKGNSSFIVSGRRTIVDPWLRPLSRYTFELDDQEGFVDYRFHDLNAKLNFYIGEKDELYISAYTGRDNYDNEVLGSITDDNDQTIQELDLVGWNWGNDILSTRWTHHFNRKTVSYLNVGISNYEFESFNFDRTIFEPFTDSAETVYSSTYYRSDINDFIINGNVDFFASSKYFLKAGFNVTSHSLSPGSRFNSTQDDLLDQDGRLTIDVARDQVDVDRIGGLENRLFVENELTFNKLIINAGLHYSFITTDNNSYHSLQPRFAAKFLLGERSQLKFSYSALDQFLHLLSSSGFGLPNDIWIPSTDIIDPQRSNEVSISYAKEFPRFGSFTISLYDRNLTNIRTLIDRGFLAIGAGERWQEELPVGRQDAFGVELEVEKRVGRFRGFLSYTLSKATNSFDSINEGESFAARLDRRHSFKINTIYQINQNLEFSASWQYSSGLFVTAPVELIPVVVDGVTEFIPIFSAINNQRLPDFHRLDIAFNLYNEYSWGRQKLSLGAYNAYNRLNPFHIDVVRNSANNAFVPQAVSIVPVFPFVSLSISF